jgi:hypothetical protein
LADLGNGRQVWQRFVQPALLDLPGVAAHYGISSLFETYGDRTNLYCYTAEKINTAVYSVGRARMQIGRTRITSRLTQEQDTLTYGVVHLGEHNLNAGVGYDRDGKLFEELANASAEVFRSGELPEMLRLLDRFFGSETYSLRSLFKDELRRILEQVLGFTLAHAETVYRQLYEEFAPLMHYLREMGMPLPVALRTAAEFALNSHLRRAIGEHRLDLEQIEKLLSEARGSQLSLDMNSLENTLRGHLEAVAQRIWNFPEEYTVLHRLDAILGLIRLFPFEVNLWRVRALFYILLRQYLTSGSSPRQPGALPAGPEAVQDWITHLLAIGEKLHIRANEKVLPAPQPVATV